MTDILFEALAYGEEQYQNGFKEGRNEGFDEGFTRGYLLGIERGRQKELAEQVKKKVLAEQDSISKKKAYTEKKDTNAVKADSSLYVSEKCLCDNDGDYHMAFKNHERCDSVGKHECIKNEHGKNECGKHECNKHECNKHECNKHTHINDHSADDYRFDDFCFKGYNIDELIPDDFFTMDSPPKEKCGEKCCSGCLYCGWCTD